MTCHRAVLEARALGGAGVPDCPCPIPAAHELEVALAGRDLGGGGGAWWPGVLTLAALGLAFAAGWWRGRH